MIRDTTEQIVNTFIDHAESIKDFNKLAAPGWMKQLLLTCIDSLIISESSEPENSDNLGFDMGIGVPMQVHNVNNEADSMRLWRQLNSMGRYTVYVVKHEEGKIDED